MEFTHRDVGPLSRRVHRLGLAANYGIDEAGVRHAFDRGVNYVFYTYRSGRAVAPLREAIARKRESVVVAGVPLFAFWGGSVRRAAERLLRSLGTDYLDVFQLPWLGKLSNYGGSTLEELRHLKESGKVRAIGISIHDRERAGKLAADSPLDVFMIRYNAAHPGAERDIFPHLSQRNPAVVAYTATSWRKLLSAPSGWKDRVPTAGDCYRFCLTSPHVDVVLTGPKSTAELDENLAAVEKGPMSDEEMAWMRSFGKAVHG